jgi:two-component system phosphate regulon sensor histidine kinase PhoR
MRPSKILLADDDPSYADAIERELVGAGYQVQRAADGVEVLEFLREDVPDVLVLDLVLPRLGGGAILSMIRQDPTLRHLPVVILSGALVERDSAGVFAGGTRIAKGPVKGTAKELLAVLETLDQPNAKRQRRSPRAPTPRRQVTELLRAVAHHEAILDVLSLGLVEVNGQGKILLANVGAERILGADRSVLLGINVLDQLPDARQSRLPSMLREAPGAGKSHPPCYLTTADRTLKVEMVPLETAGDAATCLLVLQDLTLETSLDRRKADLLGYGCHELRGALTPIWLSLKELMYLCASVGGEGGIPARVQRLEDEIQRLLAMIEDLRAVAGNEAQLFDLQLSPLDLRDVIRHVVSLQQAQATPKKVRIRTKLPYAVPTVRGNRDKLCQVMHNLLANAIRYSPSGGEIQVLAEVRGGGVVVSVEDQGPGIPAEKREHLFQTFHLGSGLHKDHGGLGLAISKGILDSHHGLIWAEGGEPTGARLLFFLPTVTEA